MKKYKVLADSITTVRGKILSKGNIYNEIDFDPAAIAQLVADKAIEEHDELDAHDAE